MVRYHLAEGVDTPAVVLITAGTWTPESSSYYGVTAPSAGQVYLGMWQAADNAEQYQMVANVAEGTSVGQFSLLSTEAEDQ
jgi:hypothetical protein